MFNDLICLLDVDPFLFQALRALLAMAPVCLDRYRSDSALAGSLHSLRLQYQDIIQSETILGEENGYFIELVELLDALQVKLKWTEERIWTWPVKRVHTNTAHKSKTLVCWREMSAVNFWFIFGKKGVIESLKWALMGNIYDLLSAQASITHDKERISW